MQPTPVIINGYNTYYVDYNSSAEPYLLIAIPPNAEKGIARICGSFVCDHLIKQVGYEIIDGIRFIKAYY